MLVYAISKTSYDSNKVDVHVAFCNSQILDCSGKVLEQVKQCVGEVVRASLAEFTSFPGVTPRELGEQMVKQAQTKLDALFVGQ